MNKELVNVNLSSLQCNFGLCSQFNHQSYFYSLPWMKTKNRKLLRVNGNGSVEILQLRQGQTHNTKYEGPSFHFQQYHTIITHPKLLQTFFIYLSTIIIL